MSTDETDPDEPLETDDPLERLTLKQRRFVEAYVGAANGNGTRAAEMAGYGGETASLATMAYRLMRKAEIRDAIAVLIEHDPLVAGRTERLRLITSIARGEATEQHIGIGGEVTEVRGNLRVRLAAAAELAKIAGDYREPDKNAGAELPPGLTIDQLLDIAGVRRSKATTASPTRAPTLRSPLG